MKYTITAITALMLTACTNDAPRFQIEAANNVIYRLDTKTGEVVASWLGQENPVTVIPSENQRKGTP